MRSRSSSCGKVWQTRHAPATPRVSRIVDATSALGSIASSVATPPERHVETKASLPTLSVSSVEGAIHEAVHAGHVAAHSHAILCAVELPSHKDCRRKRYLFWEDLQRSLSLARESQRPGGRGLVQVASRRH